jgi:N-acetylglucosamine-6-phosphate deacetylase
VKTEVTGRLATGEPVVIRCADGVIETVEPTADRADLPTVLPGLVDLQVNGYAGFDLNEDGLRAETVHGFVDALSRRGTLHVCPTLITGSEQRLVHALQTIAAARRENPRTATAIWRVNIEGPSLSTMDGPRGAHDVRWIRPPDPAEFDRWQAAAEGLVGIVTVAPEWPGVSEWIAHVVAAGVRVAIGHSAATPEQVRAAVEAGASLSTHLGNGVAATLPRHPNLIWAQLAESRLTAMFIADGHHLPADTFTVMVRAKGVERCVLTSDAVTLAGMPPGEYDTPVGGRVRIDADGAVRLRGSRLLAGSGATLLDCVRWAAGTGAVTLAQAVAMATVRPARVVGLPVERVIAPGAPADLLSLDGSWLCRRGAA